MAGTGKRCGVYILPDNKNEGTLENLLLECADVYYQNLKNCAEGFLKQIDFDQLHASELREFYKPSGHKKATVAAMGAVLKPGKSIQVSISDNRWLQEAAEQLPRIHACRQFLSALIGFDFLDAGGA